LSLFLDMGLISFSCYGYPVFPTPFV
jgi:hypothetical protein